MSKDALVLKDGDTITSNEFRSHFADVWVFVNGGKTLFVSVNNRERMALVPVSTGRQHLKEREARE